MVFVDRGEAGKYLAKALEEYRKEDAVVLALPRGGVPVAAEVAERLGLPLDLLLVRKIGVPWQPELAMGAVIDGDDPVVVRNDDVLHLAGISDLKFKRVCRAELAEIERRRVRYLGRRKARDVTGKTAIVIDDGVATGATVRAAIQGLRRRRPAKIVLAVPVAPPETIAALRRDADEVVCLEQPDHFGAISLYYANFPQVDDDTVIAILATVAAGESTTSS